VEEVRKRSHASTTQQIPAWFAEWSKNRENLAFAIQSPGKIDASWGIASNGHGATTELQGTCAQRKRLFFGGHLLNDKIFLLT
jgi:hypothetical protein